MQVAPVVSIQGVMHRYGKSVALQGIDLEIPAGKMVGVIGPDGVGKSTLLGLIAGSKQLQQGTMQVLGGDIASASHRRDACPQIAYMPQGLGKNLYLELSVRDNIDFMARLFGLSREERRVKLDQLLKATGLSPFPDRPAGKLSGGMKQKVGLCGALVHEPDLLILDEPTTGVDPLSRQQFWALIDSIRHDRPNMSVLISTAYMDEAARWDWLVAMDDGRILATGTPAELMEKTGTQDLEHCFIKLLPESKQEGHRELVIPPRPANSEIAIDANGLTRRFGDFVAVDHVTLAIERGEIFGFLGSNGCGKSTTMKMLTGLLPATEGTATIFGKSVEAGSFEVRRNLGYMTQSFSLYGELTVRENLILDARLYHLDAAKTKTRLAELVEKFGLEPYLDANTDSLPMGLKQRLSLAVAVLHEPSILILDEPTSGVDPVARDSFWELLIDLSRNQGVTIFVTTHFMNEGMRCDRISLMHAGRVLACDAPQKLVSDRGAANLEEAFIGYMEDAIAESERGKQSTNKAASAATATGDAPAAKAVASHIASHATPSNLGARRLMAYASNEANQILRDPVRLAFAFIGSALMMLVFGFGITTDIQNVRFAALDYDQSPQSRAYIEQFAGSQPYFIEMPPATSADEALERLKSDEVSLILEIPPNFAQNLKRDRQPEVLAQVDAAMTFRGETVAQYAQGIHNHMLKESSDVLYGKPLRYVADIQDRFMYNPTFESIYSMVPSIPALLLVLIPAILMAVSIVREKELGSMINFYVTPTRKLEYLIGKQLPYVVIVMANFFILAGMAMFVFGVPVKGSFLTLTACTFLYAFATTGIGMAVSSFTSSQVAAVFITAIVTMLPTLQFSGLMQPVSTLTGNAKLIGMIWPTTYYMHASVGAYTKGLHSSLILQDMLFLAACIPVLWGISWLGLRKQEK
jgi:ribosome-dependent ATPase